MLLVKVREKGTRLSEYPHPTYMSQGLPQHLGLWGGARSARWPTFISRYPDEPEVRLGDVIGPCKALVHLRNWFQTPSQGSDSCGNTWFLKQRGGSAFCLRSLADAKRSCTKPVTNTNFFWKAILESGQNWNTHSLSTFHYAGGWRGRQNQKACKRWPERKNLLRHL